MKVKARLRSFWRHNKKCMGMWAMLISVPFILIPPYHFHNILFVLIALIWLVVWKRERQIDTLHRLIGFISHKYLSMQFGNRTVNLLGEIITLSDELIKCKEENLELKKQLVELKERKNRNKRK